MTNPTEAQKINYAEMTLICDACEHTIASCKEACKNGTCKLIPPEDPKT